MAIRFNTTKYNQVKAEYLKFIEKGSASAPLMREFDVYKIYLDADEDVKVARTKQAPKPKKTELSTSEVFVHPRIASIFEQWSERVVQLISVIKAEGISDKKYKSFMRELQNASLGGEQRQSFITQIQDARKEYREREKLKMQRKQLRIHKEKIEKGQLFSITFEIKGAGSLTVDHKNILDLISNKSLDILNRRQRTQLSNAIEICYREFKDVPMIRQIQETYDAYLSPKRERTRTRRKVSENTTSQQPKTPQQIASEITDSSRYVHLPSRVTVDWKDITFHENIIRISTPIFNKPILVKKSCRRSYNTIKELLAEKLPEIIIEQIPDGTYKLVTSIELDSAVKLIRRREAEELFNDDAHHRPRLGLKKALLIAEEQESLLRRLRERKQRFINYLISLHSKLDYKVIPAVELLAHESSGSVMEEDAFIFTIPSRRTGCVCIVYENVNVARASLLFVVQKEKYMDCLQSIFNYMADEHIRNKRENLRARPTINASGVLSVYHVNHTEDMHDWTVKLKR